MKKIRTLCGYCLDHWNPSSVKQPITTHIVVRTETDEELSVRKHIVMCLRCSTETEYFPKAKTASRAEVARLKAKFEERKTKRAENRKAAREFDKKRQRS